MGTTLTMAYTVRGELFVAHAGDSRAYLLRDGQLDQLTRDHTYAQMLLDAGELAPEAAEARRSGNVVTNVVGGPDRGRPRRGPQARPPATATPCSSAPTASPSPSTTSRSPPTLAGHDDPAAACRALRDLALDAGGPDNLAIVVARFEIDRR